MGTLNNKIHKYQRLLAQLIEGKAQLVNSTPGEGITYQAVVDVKNNHFLLVSVGWSGGKFYYQVLIHIDIAPDGKIWIQQNQTEMVLAEMLAGSGIEKKDIVIAFHPEYLREHSGYAVK
ncbi:MAG: XisI protein [Saprospiraceae bacterium]|nr:XisI protein [Saprospiraceae bacterium]